jgi:hypothetical protein
MPSLNSTSEWEQLPHGWNVHCCWLDPACTEEATCRHRIKFSSGKFSEWRHVCEAHALPENGFYPLPEMPVAISR